MTPTKTVEIDFPGCADFKVKVCYLSRDESTKLRKKCMTSKFNRSTHQPEEELDEDTFIKLYSRAVIKGWSGFKYKYLEELLLVDISSLDPEDTMAWTEDNAEELVRGSVSFDTWISDTIGDLENFTQSK